MKKMQKKGSKQILKCIGLWVLIFVALFSSVVGAAVYAEDQVTVANAKALIDEAARKQVVAQKFSVCMGDRKGGEDYDRQFHGKDEIAAGKWFNDALLGKTTVEVGAWLESKTQGNYSDGKIWCEENILPMFMSTFGYSITEIACDKYSDTGNGHLKGGIFKTYNEPEKDMDCEAMNDDYRYRKVEKDKARAYIGKLYNESVAGNKYAVSWDNIGYYDPVVGYILYKQDFDTACAASYETSNSNTKTFSKKVKTVNDKGEIIEYWVKPKDDISNDNASSGASFVSGGPTTCGGLIDKMNDYADEYQKAILDAIRAECASDEVKKKVEEYIKKYEKADDLTDEQKKELEKLKNARDTGDYTQATDKGGLECAAFKDITITPTPPPNPDNPDEGEKSESEKLEEACYRQAKSLGWIICPIIFGLQEVTTQIYEKIEPMIRVNDSILDQIRQGNESGSGSMFQAWNTFRGIANIVFVILFLFIIFSQLTGVGIDNYGIKKMLPKVIITAILVNVSFLICALAVDISNVLGRSLQDLFTNIAPSNQLMGGSIVDGTINTINTTVGILGLVAAGGATFAAVALNGWAIIIPILLFLLVMIISIIFALIVLGLRQAFVVILIVISPIAFACTLLPNTEKVFKKWVDFFKQILMVYPIVGGLIGAGYFVACMIFTSNADLIMTITAGMLCVAPYFMVPSLTRKSLAAAGNIGERLRGLGQGAGRRVRGLNNTDAVKNARANSRAARDESRAQRWMNSRRAQKIQDDMAAGKTVSRRRANKYAQKAALATQSRQASIAARSAQSQYGRLSSQSGYQAAMSAANMAEDATTTKNFETMLAAGDYKYDTGRVDAEGNAVMQTVDSQSNQQIADALEHELMQTGENYDANKVRALSNALAAKGKEGRSLMYDKASAAQSNGASNQAIKDFSSNIMNNHAGTMKEKARSLYEFAKNTSDVQLDQNGNIVPSYTKNKNGESVLSGGLVDNGNGSFSLKNISEFASAGTGSLTAGDMTSMDKQQLERYSANATGDNLRTLGQLANQALTDDHLSQNLSDTSRKLLEGLRDKASSAGYDVTATSGNTLNVDHSAPTPAPTVAPAQTEAARSAGANTATVRATQISDATRARAAEQGRVNPEVERAIDQSNKGGGRQTDSGIWLPS